MAINRQTTHTSTGLRLKYYDHQYQDTDTSLIPTLTIKGLFYGRKQTNIKKENYITQAGQKTTKENMVIYTDDIIDDLTIDDFILYNNNKWIVEGVEEVVQTKFRGRKAWSGKNIYLRK